MIIQKKAINRYEDINFDVGTFLPLVDWCVRTMKEEVVVFTNGNVFITEAMLSRLEAVVQKMLPFAIFPRNVYPTNPKIIKEILAASTGQDIDLNAKEEDKLTDAQEDLRELITLAIQRKVSDVHFEVRKERCLVRFREFGDMTIVSEWSTSRAAKLAFVAFNKESDDVKSHFNSIIPHDASMQLNIDGNPVRIRLASIPAYPYPAFDLVLRILAVDDTIIPLEDLGYTETQLHLLKRSIQQKSGAIIMAGATGSGKTTTLASLINLIPREKKVYTIEDPIERKILNASQVPVNHENPLCTFSHLVRQTMRMDPDCLIVGEIRDENTAKTSSRAAITGHMVLTTLHANSATNIVLRLIDLGLDLGTLTDPGFLKVLSYQTLVKKLCPECKKPSDNNHQRQVLESEHIHVRGSNPDCPTCKGKGISGRVIVAELIELGGTEFGFIQKQAWYDWHKHFASKKTSVLDRTLELIKMGDISVEDAESAIGYIGLLHADN
jgi:type II secretory ATPase GspE/PulE/Tfp pilus assembly ATPase PilB-like protein